VWRTAKWRKRTCVGALQLKRGPVHWEWCGVPQNGTPRATVHPPSTSSSLHLLLFIHRRLPPAFTSYCSSMGSCSSSLHRLMFNQPSMGSCSTSPPRGPSIGYCSSTPTSSSIGVLFIQRQWPLLPRGPVHPTPTRTVHPTPTTVTVHQEAAAGSIGFS
jgi:hypothetical protein